MAKRYFSFVELKEKAGNFKPVGTMGNHNCMITMQSENLIVVGSSSGHVTMKEGDTLGYDCGQIWLVPSPESYRDPIRRLLAERHISQKILEYSDEPVRFTMSFESVPTGSCASSATGSDAEIFGEYKKECLNFHSDQEKEGYSSGSTQDYEITGGKCIVINSIDHRAKQETTHHRSSHLSRVIVRKNANKREIVEWFENGGEAGERKKEEES